MNDWDRNNFEYIMSLSPCEYDSWLNQASEDDQAYLQELFHQRRQELLELYDKATMEWGEEDVATASELLQQFTLKGKK